MKPTDDRDHALKAMHFRWRCKGCRRVTLLDGYGGKLHCDCAADHTDFEFMVDSGRWDDGRWHDQREALNL